MISLAKVVQEALNNVLKKKHRNGEFIVIKSYERGALKSQRCGVVSVYFKDVDKNILVYRTRICTIQDSDEQIDFDVFSEAISHIIVNWDEVWNLINTKPR